MSHADTILAMTTDAPVARRARLVEVRERDLNDLIRVLVAARRTVGPDGGTGTSHAWLALVKAVASLPAMWPASGDISPASPRRGAEERAELRASGLACQRLAEHCYLVASGSQVGESYTVVTDAFDWSTWQCRCQGGKPGNRCSHKRRVRQELEAEAKRAARAGRKTGPAVPRVTVVSNGVSYG